MSKIALTPNASGTGTLTIAAPNTSTDRTLTLPDSTGTVDTLQRAGNVLQVLSASATSSTATTTTGMGTDLSGMSVSITVSANSKVLVMATVGIYGNVQSGSWAQSGRIYITNPSNDILFESEHTGTVTNEEQINQISGMYLSGSLSAGTYTYKIKGASIVGGAVTFNRGSSNQGKITVMEIAG